MWICTWSHDVTCKKKHFNHQFNLFSVFVTVLFLFWCLNTRFCKHTHKKDETTATSIKRSCNSHCSLLPIGLYFQQTAVGTIALSNSVKCWVYERKQNIDWDLSVIFIWVLRVLVRQSLFVFLKHCIKWFYFPIGLQ